MLTNTFCHIPRISPRGERELWAAGLHSWDCDRQIEAATMPAGRKWHILTHLEESRLRLERGDPRHFAQRLPNPEQWRLFAEFRSSVAYLDIETTGLSAAGDQITTIALYDGRTIRHYVRGDNLDRFGRDICDYRLIITYNGRCFDVPFIRATLGLAMDQAHIDLRYALKSLGYGGGLKGCEKKLGLDRGDLAGVDGFMAVLLWQEYQKSRKPAALETLLAYNIQDVVNLETLMVLAYNLKLAQTPFDCTRRLPLPSPPANPFAADVGLIRRLQRRSVADPYARWFSHDAPPR